MQTRPKNLNTIMHMPKDTTAEKRAFIETFFKYQWRQVYFDFNDAKDALKRLYNDYNLAKNERFCDIFTAILSQPYKELAYYRGDDGKYVEHFPPIRFPMTSEQVKVILELDQACREYIYFYKPLKGNGMILQLSNQSKLLMIDELKIAYSNAVFKRITKLERLFKTDLNDLEDDLNDENNF